MTKSLLIVLSLFFISLSQDFYSINDILMKIGKYDVVEANAFHELELNSESFEGAYFLTMIVFNKNPNINCLGKQIDNQECAEISKYMNLFETTYRKKAIELQLMYHDQIMMADTRFMGLFMLIGLKYFDQRDFQKSVEWLNLAKLLYSEDFDFNFYLGTSYLLIEEYDKALECFEKASRINPADASIPYNIACLYGKRRDALLSAQWLKKAIELNSDYQDKYLLDSDFNNVRNEEIFIQTIGSK
jgi:tetratricopeptide (TPR) repeat protein